MTHAPLKLFVTIYHDARLLSHFLRHYRAIGVSQFFVAVGPDLQAAVEQTSLGHPVTVVAGLDVADSVAGTAAVSAMRRQSHGEREWAVIVDLDEFIECGSLPEVVAAAERAGANGVRGILHDRFALDGLPKDVTPESDLSAIYPIKARFIRNVMKGCDHKLALVNGCLEPGPRAAHHWFRDEHAFGDVLEISHYKWTSGALERLRRSLDLVQQAGSSWSAEYQRILDHVEAHGRFAWEEFGGRLSSEFVPEPPAGHCTGCGGAISEAERAYSIGTFGVALCRTDQAGRTSNVR